MWKDRGHYYEHSGKQGTEEWKEARIGRINSSNSRAMTGKSNFKTAEETGKIIAGIKIEEFTPEAIERMNHGTKMESPVRTWYEKTNNCKAVERGLCVLKSDIRIGASVDGDVLNSDVIIEIKCPVKMYRPILTYLENVDHGWKPEKGYHDHIWDSHFCQMQHGLFVLNKKFCDYIVYCSESSQVYTQRIEFDPVFWKDHYSILDTNYKKYIYPYLKPGYPLK